LGVHFGIFEFAWLNRKNSGTALKQLAIFDVSQIQKSFPKLHNVVHKIILSVINNFGANGIYF
jgi:hypothetical protein